MRADSGGQEELIPPDSSMQMLVKAYGAIISSVKKQLLREGVKAEPIDDALQKTRRGTLEELGKLNTEFLDTTTKNLYDIIEAIKTEPLRHDYLGRMLINEIQDFLSRTDNEFLDERAGDEFVYGIIPRQIIPGLLIMFRRNFGDDYIIEKEKTAEDIVSKFKIQKGIYTLVDWKGVMESGRTKVIIKEMYSRIEARMKDPASKERLIGIIKNDSGRGLKRDFAGRDYEQLVNLLFMDKRDLRSAIEETGKIAKDLKEANPEAILKYSEIFNRVPNDLRQLFIVTLMHKSVVDTYILSRLLELRYKTNKDLRFDQEMNFVSEELLSVVRWSALRISSLPSNSRDPVIVRMTKQLMTEQKLSYRALSLLGMRAQGDLAAAGR